MSCIGRFSCCKFLTFFTEVKVAKSSDISRNMLQSITMSTYANRSCCVRVLRPTNSLGHTETGPRFKVSSERLEKPGIELTTPGLQSG